jgi:hypothetical protein
VQWLHRRLRELEEGGNDAGKGAEPPPPHY